MSLWDDILGRVERARLVLEKTFRPTDPSSRVGFTIALVALSAKLAKADGRVSVSEVRAFRSVVDFPASEEDKVARVFNLCRRETRGYEHYARRLARAIRGHEAEQELRDNIMDALVIIATAEGDLPEPKIEFLRRVAGILGMSRPEFGNLLSGHLPEEWCPYMVLGVEQGQSAEDIREAWRNLVRENHPDSLTAKGLPQEAISIATRRLARINRAYEEMSELLASPAPGGMMA